MKFLRKAQFYTLLLLLSVTIFNSCTKDELTIEKEEITVEKEDVSLENIENESKFKTVPTTVMDIDGNIYHTVTIGEQVWMVENLRTTKYRNGDPIPNVTSNASWSGLTSGAYCWYNNNSYAFPIYGVLYNKMAVIDSRNIAPEGWHVATSTEWVILANYVGDNPGDKLREQGFQHWIDQYCLPSTNEFGFTALPSGMRNKDGLFHGIGVSGNWWTNRTDVQDHRSIYGHALYGSILSNKEDGLSVRCIMDPVSNPIITTSNVSNIVVSSATCGGNITSDGGSPITARGVCWSSSPNPTISNSRTIDGIGEGTFVSTITGLAWGYRYYVRSYATNILGTTYGNEVSFISAVPPTLTTVNPSKVIGGNSTSGGNITSDGGVPIIERGVCWSTSYPPTIVNSKTSNGSGIGSFVSNLTGLNWRLNYYVRSYATNSNGTTFYGNTQQTFKVIDRGGDM